jgi:REP element-mobilizing transposase RayT
MANTYTQIYIQTVFVEKYRQALIQPEWEHDLHRVIGHQINEQGGKSIIVNGISDHVHCFFHLKPTQNLSEMMKHVKSKSSKWINDQKFLKHHFSWQSGFGGFSYGHSQKSQVYNYIHNQKTHHQKISFAEEYQKLLNSFEIDYNEQYLFHKPE